MNNIFDGLDALGLNKIEKPALFPDAMDDVLNKEVIEKKRIDNAKEILFDRKLECPVCGMDFTSRSIRAGKIRLVDSDTDLRPHYTKLDPIMYDVVLCSTCGYASLAKTFKEVKKPYVAKFKQDVSTQFIGKNYPEVYTYDDAIERYKMALLAAQYLDKSLLEKAYLCLKLSWLYRSKRKEYFDQETKEIQTCMENERLFVDEAYEGFKWALRNETLPKMGFDQMTIKYLVGELARRKGNLSEAHEIMHQLKIHPLLSRRLKKRVNSVFELIVESLDIERQHKELSKE